MSLDPSLSLGDGFPGLFTSTETNLFSNWALAGLLGACSDWANLKGQEEEGRLRK